jgi:hypothetical protein
MADTHKEDKTMKKRLMLYAVAALLALALPARAADRTYTLCDPAKAKMCASLVALYEFEEAANYDRTSETGTAPFLERGGYDLARSSTHKTGSYSLAPDTGSGTEYLYIPRSPSLGTSFTANVWLYADSLGATSTLIGTYDDSGTKVGSYLSDTNTSSVHHFRFTVKQSMTDTVSYVEDSTTLSATTWYFVSFGIYASPTTTEPYQSTLWIRVNGGAATTQTITYPPQVFLGDFRIGNMDRISAYKFDQLSIFSGTLSAGEVSWLCNSGSGRAYPFTANP